MQEIPQLVSLVTQTERILSQGILRGAWKFHLPGERSLCKELQISRGTLRSALRALEKKNLIRIRQGLACEIVQKSRGKAQVPRLSRVGCLAPERLWRLSPFTVIYIDELRYRLQRKGIQLDLYYSPRCYGSDGGKALAKLVDQNPHSAWLVLLSTRAMQLWFEEKRLPTIISGSLYEGVRLPSLDTNFRAVGRHAGGMMFARGHRRIALLAAKLDHGPAAPGTLEIEQGMQEAVLACPHADKTLTVVYHDQQMSNACASLDRLLSQQDPPTAILIGHSMTLLMVLTHLARQRIVIPDDLSIVVTHSEPYYAHMVPDLTHYEWDPSRFAAEAGALFQYALNQAPIPERCIRPVPRFVPGKTLATLK